MDLSPGAAAGLAGAGSRSQRGDLRRRHQRMRKEPRPLARSAAALARGARNGCSACGGLLSASEGLRRGEMPRGGHIGMREGRPVVAGPGDLHVHA